MNEEEAKPVAPPKYYPAFLDLRGKRCIVVGGGRVALRKVEGLLEAGAAVTVIAPEQVALPAEVCVLRRIYQRGDLAGARLVLAATNDASVNAEVAREAEERGILLNVVDDPAHCSFIVPALLRRGALCLAISTGGASPTLARRLREQLEEQFGPEYAALLELLHTLRQQWEPRAKAANLSADARRRAWERVLDLPLLDWLRAGEVSAARHAAESVLEAMISDLFDAKTQSRKDTKKK